MEITVSADHFDFSSRVFTDVGLSQCVVSQYTIQGRSSASNGIGKLTFLRNPLLHFRLTVTVYDDICDQNIKAN